MSLSTPTDQSGKPPVVVIGAGPSGLALASDLAAAGRRMTVLEKQETAGGAVRTFREGGWLVEAGPNSLQIADVRLHDGLVKRGLDGILLETLPAAKKRLIALGGKPVEAPGSPPSFFASKLLTWKGKLRMMREPFIAKGTDPDETFDSFVTRRLGAEALERLAGPFVAGIYAGDPRTLSVRHAFPKLWNLEQKHGSFIRGAIAMRRLDSGFPKRACSCAGGLSELIGALAAKLPEGSLRTGATVTQLERGANGWNVRWDDAQGGGECFGAEVVCAVPAHAVAGLPWPEAVAGRLGFLGRVRYPAVASVSLGYARSQVAHPLDGFGMLLPEKEPASILGCLFPSSLFPGRAPEGHVLLTVFVGGSRRDVSGLSTSELEAQAHADVARFLGITGRPVFHKTTLWPKAIPQYEKGYGEILDGLDAVEKAAPGLHFLGNHRKGIALGASLLAGWDLAGRM